LLDADNVSLDVMSISGSGKRRLGFDRE